MKRWTILALVAALMLFGGTTAMAVSAPGPWPQIGASKLVIMPLSSAPNVQDSCALDYVWREAQWMNCNNTFTRPEDLLPSQPGGTPIVPASSADFQARFKIGWHANDIYIFVEVFDDADVTRTLLVNSDSLELYFNFSNELRAMGDNGTGGLLGDAAFQKTLWQNQGGPAQMTFRWNGNRRVFGAGNGEGLYTPTALTDNEAIYTVSNTTAGKTLYEVRVKMPAVVNLSSGNYDSIGFALAVNDTDPSGTGYTARRTWGWWGSQAAHYSETLAGPAGTYYRNLVIPEDPVYPDSQQTPYVHSSNYGHIGIGELDFVNRAKMDVKELASAPNMGDSAAADAAWDVLGWYNCNNTFNPATAVPASAADFQARFKAGFYGRDVYMLVEVQDDVDVNTSTPGATAKDSLDVFWNFPDIRRAMGNDGNGNATGDASFQQDLWNQTGGPAQMHFLSDGTVKIYGDGNGTGTTAVEDTEAIYSVSRDGGVTRYEIKFIPPERAVMEDPDVDAQAYSFGYGAMGFALAVNDVDAAGGTARTWGWWGSPQGEAGTYVANDFGAKAAQALPFVHTANYAQGRMFVDRDVLRDGVTVSDGVPACVEWHDDFDGDGIPNYLDFDADGDGIDDIIEGALDIYGDPPDTDNDRMYNFLDLDSDNDWIPDSVERGCPEGGTPVDSDGDGTPDYLDPDSDNDSIPDAIEAWVCGYVPTSGQLQYTPIDTDGDGTPDYLDLDSDDDSLSDTLEAWVIGYAPSPGELQWTPLNTDGDAACDFRDTDSDGDSIPDEVEAWPTGESPDPGEFQVDPEDTDGDGLPDFRDVDSDGDSIPDAVEAGPNGNSPRDTDGDGAPDYRDIDSDGDSVPDMVEAWANGVVPVPGQLQWNPVDTDGDGTADYRDWDSDADSIPDVIEAWPTGESPEPGEYQSSPVDTDNDGAPDYRDTDSDLDTIPDVVEAWASGVTPGVGQYQTNPVDTDGDGAPDYRDVDSDADTIPDSVEAGPNGSSPRNTDGDGAPDYRDVDSDGDSIPDIVEAWPSGFTPGAGALQYSPVDTDGDSTPDYRETDSDADSLPDVLEAWANGVTPGAGQLQNSPVNTDGDGLPDYRDLDSDGDSIPDSVEAGWSGSTARDTDADGKPDFRDVDSDGDSIPDVIEAWPTGVVPGPGELQNSPVDTDGAGGPDYRDTDADGDGIPDVVEAWSSGYTPTPGQLQNAPVDSDGDGAPDYRDLDTDSDGVPDSVEGYLDVDSDGVPNFRDLDSDADGYSDTVEYFNGSDPYNAASTPIMTFVYVDFNHITGLQAGTADNPLGTLSEALFVVSSGGTIHFVGDPPITSTSDTPRITKPMRMETGNQPVSIGE